MIDCCFKGCSNGLKLEKPETIEQSKNHLQVSGTPAIPNSPVSWTPEFCILTVSQTPVKCERPVAGIPENLNTFTVEKIYGVQDSDEMQNAIVPDTVKLFLTVH